MTMATAKTALITLIETDFPELKTAAETTIPAMFLNTSRINAYSDSVQFHLSQFLVEQGVYTHQDIQANEDGLVTKGIEQRASALGVLLRNLGYEVNGVRIEAITVSMVY